VAAALETGGELEGFPVTTAEAGEDGVGAAEEGDEDGEAGLAGFEEGMDDGIGVADEGVDVADAGADFDDVLAAPCESDGVFDAAFDGHDFEQGMVEEPFELAVDEGVKVPELVNLHEPGVVAGEGEVGVIFEEEVGDVIEVDEAVEGRGGEVVLPEEFVAEGAGGLADVVDELGLAGFGVGDVVVDDEPVGFVEAGLEGEVGDPGGAFAEVALAPDVVVVGLEGDGDLVQVPGEALKEEAGDKAVEVAFVGEDDLGLGRHLHGGKGKGRAGGKASGNGGGPFTGDWTFGAGRFIVRACPSPA